MDAVRALYRAAAAVAEHHAEDTIVALHVPTPVDDVLAAEVAAGRIVFVTGNPGDGKTHLIRRTRDRFPRSVEVCLDANERSNDDLAHMVDAALAQEHGLVMAINEGILVDLSGMARPRAWAADVRQKLLRALRYEGGQADDGDPRICVIDLNLRNTLGREVVVPAIDRVLTLAGLGEECPPGTWRAARNAQILREEADVRERLVDLLDTVGRSGVHATMRDLLGFLAYVICGDRSSCPPGQPGQETQPYYVNAFEGGAGPLFDAVRRFDPLWRPMPLLDDALWRHTDVARDWLVANGVEVRRPGEEEPAFVRRKRRAYFEHRSGRGDLELAGGDVDLVFREMTDRRRAGPRRLIGLLNRFFDRTDTAEDMLHLWATHRYDARPTRYVAARWHVPALQMRVLVPELPPQVAAAFPSYRPDHVILTHKDLTPGEGLIVDRTLLEALLGAQVGGTSARSGEPRARIAAFFDRLARIARREWLATPSAPQVQVLDMDAGQRVVLGVDVDTGSFVRP
ncbi:hypothetical protein [Methylobacterium sp. sgz302541]|uniref:hypothetical protein n=1 Tax=unclassified Methylobacterium TaxID=2615210 RepID=UPI003D34A8AB